MYRASLGGARAVEANLKGVVGLLRTELVLTHLVVTHPVVTQFVLTLWDLWAVKSTVKYVGDQAAA